MSVSVPESYIRRKIGSASAKSFSSPVFNNSFAYMLRSLAENVPSLLKASTKMEKSRLWCIDCGMCKISMSLSNTTGVRRIVSWIGSIHSNSRTRLNNFGRYSVLAFKTVLNSETVRYFICTISISGRRASFNKRNLLRFSSSSISSASGA